MKTLIICSAFIIRMLLLAYGCFHDEMMEVKFTDIDYSVFTDAAKLVTQGKSPYLKSTYKYTPLLAYLVTPNILLHPLFGKILFCICDVLVVFILDTILRKKMNCSESLSNILILSCWVYNPFTMTISSRGNAESVEMLFVLLSLLLIMQHKPLPAGIFYGIAVHFKLYPIIYSLPFLLFIGSNRVKVVFKGCSPKVFLGNVIKLISSLDCILFGATSLSVFCLLGYLMYCMYGVEFVENTYLYHLSRQDIQHNFSPYFFILRLIDDTSWSSIVKSVAFLPQMIIVIWLGLRYYKQLPLACFLQTFAFVSLNKVCTSQYFIWYIGLFPLAYPYMRIPLKRLSWMVTSWLTGQAVWLFLAYLLEFKQLNVIVYVWLASVCFVVINMFLLNQFTLHASQCSDPGKDKDKKE